MEQDRLPKMINYFARTNKVTSIIRLMYANPEIGPSGFAPPEEGEEDIQLAGEWVYSDPPSETCQLTLVGGVPRWIDSVELTASIEAAALMCYPDIKSVTQDAMGVLEQEYDKAEAAARAFAAAGYSGPVSGYVSSLAKHKGQTDEWAAKLIIEKADAFDQVQEDMRDKRFEYQAAMRACATVPDLELVRYLWSEYITSVRAKLGLKTTS